MVGSPTPLRLTISSPAPDEHYQLYGWQVLAPQAGELKGSQTKALPYGASSLLYTPTTPGKHQVQVVVAAGEREATALCTLEVQAKPTPPVPPYTIEAQHAPDNHFSVTIHVRDPAWKHKKWKFTSLRLRQVKEDTIKNRATLLVCGQNTMRYWTGNALTNTLPSELLLDIEGPDGKRHTVVVKRPLRLTKVVPPDHKQNP
ncbi:MAG: hypothetical protein AAFQ78_00065 [Bacteroidota bacterium]